MTDSRGFFAQFFRGSPARASVRRSRSRSRPIEPTTGATSLGAHRATIPSVERAVVIAALRERWSQEGARGDTVFRAHLRRAIDADDVMGIFPDVALRLDRLVRTADPPLDEVVSLLGRDVELSRAVVVAASSAVHGRAIEDLGGR